MYVFHNKLYSLLCSGYNLHVVNASFVVHRFLHLANQLENFVTKKTAIRGVIPEHTVQLV